MIPKPDIFRGKLATFPVVSGGLVDRLTRFVRRRYVGFIVLLVIDVSAVNVQSVVDYGRLVGESPAKVALRFLGDSSDTFESDEQEKQKQGLDLARQAMLKAGYRQHYDQCRLNDPLDEWYLQTG